MRGLIGALVALLLWPFYLLLHVLQGLLRLLAKCLPGGAPSASQAPVPPQRRRWALALSDILAQRNGLPVGGDSLQVSLEPASLERLSAQLLRELDLPERIHPQAIPAKAGEALRRWVGGLGRPPTDFYDALAARGQVRDALAFECARTAFLVRCMALLGWVPDTQAWTVLLLNAQRAQDSFDSWSDFGHAYARARQQWLAMSAPDGPTSHRARLEVEAHLAHKDSSWNKLPWKDWRIFEPEREHESESGTGPEPAQERG